LGREIEQGRQEIYIQFLWRHLLENRDQGGHAKIILNIYFREMV
jgi:hypothetical protein